ncbi:hypothetical protein LIA77_07371 [Sarocladium implicatum]|nr:hypothetical protein LIA77_07371 [Sarocladium implicatum]
MVVVVGVDHFARVAGGVRCMLMEREARAGRFRPMHVQFTLVAPDKRANRAVGDCTLMVACMARCGESFCASTHDAATLESMKGRDIRKPLSKVSRPG